MRTEYTSHSVQRARQKSMQRDNQIRKIADETLSKITAEGKGFCGGSSVKHEVGQFDLCEPETILQSNTLVEAARHMAAKRLDFVLVADGHGKLVGILTDKDLAYRVIAAGLNPRTTLVGMVMTKNPVCVSSSLTIVEALEIMSKNNFRHLPVKEEDIVLGVLDIAKCLYDALQKLELADAAAHQIASALETVSKEFAVSREECCSNDALSYAETLRDTLCSPLLTSVLNSNDDREDAFGLGNQKPLLTVNIKYNVFEATKIMKERKETALLVTDEQGALVGIFTTKDILLRIVAAGLDAQTTSIIRVMTPHPDYVTPTTSIVAALRQIHAGNYLHLPVLGDSGKKIMGVVGVMQLTYAVLEQLKALRGSEDHHLWNQFWSPPSIADIEVSSHTASVRGVSRQPTYVLPEQAPEATADPSDDFCLLSGLITFKIKLSKSDAAALFLPSVDIHNVPSLRELEDELVKKFGTRSDGIFYYVDDENDLIPVSSDEELIKFVNLIVANSQEKITLLYEEPARSCSPFIMPQLPLSMPIDPTVCAVIGVVTAVGLLYFFRSR